MNISCGPVGGPAIKLLLSVCKFLSIILRERLCILLCRDSFRNVCIEIHVLVQVTFGYMKYYIAFVVLVFVGYLSWCFGQA